VISNIIEIPTDADSAASRDRLGPSLRAEPSEWLKLLDGLTEPAAFIDKGLAEIDRIQGELRQPRRGAVVGTNMLGLLATLALRMRGAEVVTIGSLPEPLLSPNRIKGITGWKHLWMNPALAPIPLVQETGASYVCASELSTDRVKRRFGPVDVTVVSSAGLASVPGLTRRLAETGALVDLTLGNGEMEMWTATPTPSFLEKHRVTFQVGGVDRVFIERAPRNLAMADALYPGWLERLLESFEPLGMPARGVPRLKAERLRGLGDDEAIQDYEGERDTDLFAMEVTR
jgi:glucose 1-dehydrogenase